MTDPAPSPLLFEPIELRSVRAHNRIVISPMCQYNAPTAVPHDWHFVHLVSRAVGGAGIVMTEATAVEPAGRITPYDVGLWNDEQSQAFARIARGIAEHGALPGMQLAHAGRKASHRRPWEDRTPLTVDEGGWEVFGPSPIAWEPGDLVPVAMSHDDLAHTVESFASAARRALDAGFRILELHAAHGYLLHSFMSPISNRRDDEYGGSFENRVRLMLNTVRAVRGVWPEELPLSVRLSATDWVDDGWDLPDTIRLAGLLGPLGVDVIDCSSGGSTPRQSIRPFAHYQAPFAAAVRRETGLRTAAVGLLSEPEMVEQMLARGEADLAVLGRIALWDPYWPHHAAAALGLEPRMPLPYARSNIYARGGTLPGQPRSSRRPEPVR